MFPMLAPSTRPAPSYSPPKTTTRQCFIACPTKKLCLFAAFIPGDKKCAKNPAVVDVPHGKGNVVLFANNPMWRGETMGSYFLVFNAMLNFDHLDAGGAAVTSP